MKYKKYYKQAFNKVLQPNISSIHEKSGQTKKGIILNIYQIGKKSLAIFGNHPATQFGNPKVVIKLHLESESQRNYKACNFGNLAKLKISKVSNQG